MSEPPRLNQLHDPRRPLDDALLRLRLEERRSCQSVFSAPWAVSVPDCRDVTMFVFVAQGSCRCRWPESELTLQKGDYVLLPHGHGHVLGDPDATATSSAPPLEWDSLKGRCIINAGGDGPMTHLVTGCLKFEVNPIIPLLPDVLMLPRDQPIGWTTNIIDALCEETMRPGPGGEVVISHLVELLAIGVIRQHLQQNESGKRILHGMNDPDIRRALDLMHKDPAIDWSLPALAEALGMSRSALSARFQEFIGVPPMRYWAQWRMSVATQWLRERQCTVDEVALQFGYGSRAAFSRAFKLVTGTSPGQIRKQGRIRLRTLNDQIIGEAGPVVTSSLSADEPRP